MDQHTFVRECYNYYAKNYYEPGNPEDGEWQDCHYPVPKCLGGTTTILLLKHHHAIHGILQSEEYEYPCIFNWEIDYLPDEYLHLFNKWKKKKFDLSLQRRMLKRGIAFELLLTTSHHDSINPSTPKPVLIHYLDGTTLYAESIKHASRLTNVPQSTIQRRLKQSVQHQLPTNC